ncbi:Oxygen-independent coproporphyrinogen-III oxidase-like protein YqeR [invertebrate metagenome]|uniref:Oxygen-independent coproporphyrinogen-III oxidase-like protein YqeR n=1 Tax=invertebrate metagenome TaxID=1711999 RepID=A0A2H9TBW0_9ZZZZ
MLKLPPLSLYIHVPWCIRKCPYCDFNSHAVKTDIPETDYLNQLLWDLKQELPKVQERELHSIFVGGGTPSLLSPKGYQWLFARIAELIPFSTSMEITMEANPGACEYGALDRYVEAGINRFSFGVQSFQNDKLKALGRIHSAEEAIKAIKALKATGVPNFNIDLMHGLPGQSVADALTDLQQAITLEPAHISWYQLTIEPNTVFYSRPPQLPNDEKLWNIQEQGQALLATAGFQQYEISAYAGKNQNRSQHNLNYWQFGDYLGIGAGAHGKWTDQHTSAVFRNRKTRMPKDYLETQDSFEAGVRQLTAEDLRLECLMNSLRLNDGMEASLYTERTGMALSTLQPGWQHAIDMKLMEKGNRLKATTQGRLFLNDLLAYFT